MIELRQLRYFVKIAELEHFGRAAKALHIVQPALSRQVKQLENEIGIELFERLPRGVRLTQAGIFFAERTNQILSDLDRALVAARLAAKGQKGFLRVGFADGTIFSEHVPRIIKVFRDKFPDVELELVPATSMSQAELLLNNSINIGFVYWLPVNQSEIEHFEINKERIILAVPKSHKLSKRKSVKLMELQDSRFVWIKRANSPAYYDLILSKCAKAGLIPNVVQEGTTESIMLSLVSAEIGITFITESAISRKQDNIAFLEVEDLKANLSVKAMWRAEESSPALREFIAVARALKDLN